MKALLWKFAWNSPLGRTAHQVAQAHDFAVQALRRRIQSRQYVGHRGGRQGLADFSFQFVGGNVPGSGVVSPPGTYCFLRPS